MDMKQDRFILIITSEDPTEWAEDSGLKKDEILPGVLAFVYGKPLSPDELEELREKLRGEPAEPSDSLFDEP
jgi:hypothetical protein